MPGKNVAVIGAGFGQNHVKALLQCGKARLVAVCDADSIRRKQLDALLPEGCRSTADIEDVLHDDRIDIVSLSLPHHLHEKFAIEAANAGKHIMLDKPIARTVAEAKNILAAAKMNHVKLMVAFNRRFEPNYRLMHDLALSGKVGKIVYGTTRHYQIFDPPANSNWRFRKSTGGGCIIGSGIHNIDMVRWIFGEPSTVYAHASYDQKRLDAEAAVSVTFAFESGVTVNFICNWCASGACNYNGIGEIEVFGDLGDLAIQNDTVTMSLQRGKEKMQYDSPFNLSFSMGMTALWDHFIACIENDTEPECNGIDATKTLALAECVYESIRTGQVQKYEPVF